MRFRNEKLNQLADLCVTLFNEEKNVPLLISNFKEAKKWSPYLGNLILIDNGSTDKTWEILKKHESDTILVGKLEFNEGYGGGAGRAIAESKNENVCLISANNQYPFDQIIKLLEIYVMQISKSETKFLVKGLRVDRSDPQSIRILSYVYTCLVSIAIGRKFADINGLPKIFRKEIVLEELKHFPNNPAFDAAILLEAKRKDVRIIEIPIQYLPRLHGNPSWSKGRFKTSLKMLSAILKYRFKR